jgi:PadR family transcriptional regulator, regulatory protein PadR
MSPLANVEREPIPPGTLDLLILKTLARAGSNQLHGFEIADTIQQRSRSVLQVEEGSLYPALQRMLVKGWIAGEWGHTPERRRARYYRMTAAGKRQLERELESYKRVTAAVALIIQSS